MLSQTWSCATHGVDAVPIQIETNVSGGLPKLTIVGLPRAAVRESFDRVRAALKNTGLPYQWGRITVNLAPADLPKETAAFDLPMAVGWVAASSTRIAEDVLARYWVTGELALDGSVRPVEGVLPMAMAARARGCAGILVPAGNADEAAVVDGIRVYPVANVTEAVDLLGAPGGPPEAAAVPQTEAREVRSTQVHVQDFADVRGQENVKRALEVAAAGGHNALLVGPPGSGKTMLARRVPTVLPPMTRDEALETTKIHSVSGRLKTRGGIVADRPFRAPHHTISDAGLCGGGASPKPGEISLSHNGVLFLDELPEFQRRVLEVMRQPLEEGCITISRARTTVTYPARFMLIASMNPCPCGHLNDPGRDCVCAPAQVQRYLSRISGPLMDRIDLHMEVAPVDFEELSGARNGESSKAVRRRVVAARRVQDARFREHPGVHCNAQMDGRLVHRYCALNDAGRRLLKRAVDRMGLSARGYTRILKVGRTIADLGGSEAIRPEDVSEAVQYRSLDRDWWNG